MLKTVILVTNHRSKFCGPGSYGTNVLTLECGHTNSRKVNVPIPKKAQCRWCGDAAVKNTTHESAR